MIQKISATVTLLRPSHKVLLTGALVALPVLFSPAWAGSLFSGPPGNPCRGPGSLLALLNRPTVSDSSCTVAAGRVMVEGGWQRLNLYEVPGGRSVNYPEFEFSFGLPHRTEIVVLPPNERPSRRNPPG
jgi:hypothetical protein